MQTQTESGTITANEEHDNPGPARKEGEGEALKKNEEETCRPSRLDERFNREFHGSTEEMTAFTGR